MRLIDPGPGEFLDRETILLLKIKAAGERGRDSAHFESELEGVRLRLLRFIGHDRWAEWHAALTRINDGIWHNIDNLRDNAGNSDAAAFFGLEALYGNDQRAALIQEINRECGMVVGEEKIR